jgi:hypothetical protein
MKYYRYNGEVFAFETDGSQDNYIPNGAVLMTDPETQAHLFPASTVESVNARRINELKSLLASTDYKVLPDYDCTDDAVIAQRQAWRDEIRVLLEN